MAFVVVVVLDEMSLCPDLLESWEKAGVPGATILESTGLHRLTQKLDDVPLIPSMRSLLEQTEFPHRTIFTVVPDQGTVDRLVAATQRVIDFSRPHSGVLFVLPVTEVLGLKCPGPGTAP